MSTEDIAKEQKRQALISSLRMLAASPKSRKVLGERLTEKGYPPEIVAETLSQLEGRGLLSDRAFAENLVQSLAQYRQSGRKRIAFELRRKGIEEPMIEEVMGKYSSEEERARAFELAERQAERCSKLMGTRRRKKIYDYLVRRGFEFEVARQAVAHVMRAGEK